MGREGKSLSQMAAALDCARSSLADWTSMFPEFAASLARAREFAQAFWEDRQSSEFLFAQGLNESIFKQMMASRFREDYRESRSVELTGKDGGPVRVAAVDMTEEQIRARLAELRAGGTD